MNLSPFNSLHLYSSSPVDPLSSSAFVIHPLQLCTSLTSFWVSFPVRAIASVLMHHGQQTNSHGGVSSALRGFQEMPLECCVYRKPLPYGVLNSMVFQLDSGRKATCVQWGEGLHAAFFTLGFLLIMWDVWHFIMNKFPFHDVTPLKMTVNILATLKEKLGWDMMCSRLSILNVFQLTFSTLTIYYQ